MRSGSSCWPTRSDPPDRRGRPSPSTCAPSRDTVLARALSTALWLALARDTYTPPRPGHPGDDHDTAQDPRELLAAAADPDALRAGLIGRFFHHAYPDPRRRAHALRWLSWTARHLGDGRDIAWWQIATHPAAGRLAGGLAVGLAFG